MNMLKNGIQFLADTQEQATSEAITYRSDSRLYGPFNAVLSTAEMDEAEEVASEFISSVFDFIFKANLIPDPPAPGDRIIYAGQIYEVMHGLTNGPWRFSDPYRLRYRVHTQNIGSAT